MEVWILNWCLEVGISEVRKVEMLNLYKVEKMNNEILVRKLKFVSNYFVKS